MTAVTSPPRLRASEGCLQTRGGVVRWRLGVRDPAEAASTVARAWVEEIVRTHGLFAWTGFAAVPPFSKPRLASDGADFSVSHSGGFVLVAVGVGVRVGVDVEAAPFEAFRSAALRRRMLTPAEHDRLARVPTDARLPHLARVWTAKEALVKASGEGLRRDFRRFAVPALLEAPVFRLEAALAVLSRDAPPEVHRLTPLLAAPMPDAPPEAPSSIPLPAAPEAALTELS